MKWLIFLLFFVFSCSNNKINIFLEEGNSSLELTQDNYRLKIISRNEDIEKVKKILKFYKNAKLTYSEEIEFKDPYSLFFKLGNNFYGYMKNDVIRFGMIESEWLNFQKELKQNEIFRINEIDSYIKNNFSEKDKKDLYKFAVNYLAKENLFVSIQEFFDRPYRYFNINELYTIFMRLVIIPESKEFTEYLIKKFGKNKVIQFSKKEYTKENWQKSFGEKINDFEEEFFKYIENYKFSKNYNSEFENLIAIYNKNSKKTLFKK
ncbi:MAG: hypothetical protein ACP5Q5_01950 [Brevinematia bacterium]